MFQHCITHFCIHLFQNISQLATFLKKVRLFILFAQKTGIYARAQQAVSKELRTEMRSNRVKQQRLKHCMPMLFLFSDWTQTNKFSWDRCKYMFCSFPHFQHRQWRKSGMAALEQTNNIWQCCTISIFLGLFSEALQVFVLFFFSYLL